MSTTALTSWSATAAATRTSASATMPQSLFGYDIIDVIGEGAGSTIYAVSQSQSKQLYALKHVVRNKDKDVRFIEQLESEYNVGRKITHVNLRRSIDLQIKRTLLGKATEAALVLELFDGNSLEFNLPRQLHKLLQVFIQTAKALEGMHAAGFVHCDLKPNNIMVNPQGKVKVIDLGQACPIGTEKKRIQGTPDYIAPEQVKLMPVTPQTDIFNLGATMYWALSGQKLPTLFTVSKAKNAFLVDAYIPAPHQHNSQVPENLSNFVMECVKTNPKKRPADMGELIRRLEIMRHGIERAGAAHSAR